MLASWKDANITLILKPGKCPKICDSYRPISLNCNYKIYAKVLADRLNGSIAGLIQEDQKCFI